MKETLLGGEVFAFRRGALLYSHPCKKRGGNGRCNIKRDTLCSSWFAAWNSSLLLLVSSFMPHCLATLKKLVFATFGQALHRFLSLLWKRNLIPKPLFFSPHFYPKLYPFLTVSFAAFLGGGGETSSPVLSKGLGIGTFINSISGSRSQHWMLALSLCSFSRHWETRLPNLAAPECRLYVYLLNFSCPEIVGFTISEIENLSGFYLRPSNFIAANLLWGEGGVLNFKSMCQCVCF